jgi:hypothetical protein
VNERWWQQQQQQQQQQVCLPQHLPGLGAHTGTHLLRFLGTTTLPKISTKTAEKIQGIHGPENYL